MIDAHIIGFSLWQSTHDFTLPKEITGDLQGFLDRMLLGDLELWALATRHGNELATLALRSAQNRGAARDMLWWIERWRATALAVPRTTPSPDHDLERQVAALRDVARRLDAADASGSDGLRQERGRLEAEVRRTRRRERADGSRAPAFDADRIFEALGDTVLVTLVSLDGALSAITVANGRVRRRPVGPLEDALREARFARFALRRAACQAGSRCENCGLPVAVQID